MLRFIILSSILLYALHGNTYENKIILATTTSTYDTGLLSHLNNFFEDKYNIKVQVLVQGTGQALRTAADGNVEILLVHHKKSELNFMNSGFGKIRYDLMYNDYIIVGPKNADKCVNIVSKLTDIYNKKLTFISRGDDSGTHKKELELWKLVNLDSNIFNSWYLKIGQGMGNALLIANQKFAYTLSDRGTWFSFNNKDNLKIICESFPPLFNQYGLILVNQSLNKNLNIKSAKIYVDWLISDESKNLINNFKKSNQQLFFFNHH